MDAMLESLSVPRRAADGYMLVPIPSLRPVSLPSKLVTWKLTGDHLNVNTKIQSPTNGFGTVVSWRVNKSKWRNEVEDVLIDCGSDREMKMKKRKSKGQCRIPPLSDRER
ncbi:hypothetical protein HID58_079915 [Brassica napus]|uniref:Uncharacterized protein n=1 Tax=Brassica napus TaxID=3708 RepID=A0ABQ7Y3D1_BRANA|nr:hypothetical protein HID58_079915 [Brassica napus]